MKSWDIFRKLIKKTWNLTKLAFNKKNMFRIDEIDLKTGMVILYSYKLRSILKAHITEVISDKNILKNLSSLHASRLGYYLGKLNFKNAKHTPLFGEFLPSKGYQLIFAESSGTLKYRDQKNNQFYDYPEVILEKGIVENFDPSQASYIGFLAGLRSKKNKVVPIIKSPPYLTLVKNS